MVIDASPELFHLEDQATVEVVLKSKKYTFTKRIIHCLEIGGRLIIKLEGIDSITAAWKLIGYEIWTAAVLDEPHESPALVGYTVIDTAQLTWGTVQAVEDESANPLLYVVSAAGQTVREIPYHESIIIAIDHEARIITIDPPSGLYDLNT